MLGSFLPELVKAMRARDNTSLPSCWVLLVDACKDLVRIQYGLLLQPQRRCKVDAFLHWLGQRSRAEVQCQQISATVLWTVTRRANATEVFQLGDIATDEVLAAKVSNAFYDLRGPQK